MSDFTPGVYVKGNIERIVRSRSAAVAATFEGFKPKEVELVAVDPGVDPDTDVPAQTAAPKPGPAKPKN